MGGTARSAALPGQYKFVPFVAAFAVPGELFSKQLPAHSGEVGFFGAYWRANLLAGITA